MFRRPLLVSTAIVVALTSCAGDDTSGPEVFFEFEDVSPGSVVGLIAVDGPDRRTVEWIDRLDGTIRRIDIDDPSDPDLVATIPVSTDGEQRGLLGQTIIDGRRFAAWTQPATFELVVAEVVNGSAGAIMWSAGRAGGGAIGGVLREYDGQILLGLGRNTAFDADTSDGGAILAIDPGDTANGPDPAPSIFSLGYTNPWAFTVLADRSIWVADNAAGPDPDDETRDDVERIGRADLLVDRNEMDEVTWPGRAPTSMTELPDGRIGICGFLDNELRAYEIVETDDPQRPTLERAGTIMPCNLGAAVFDDGTIVTIAQSDNGETLHILRP